MTKLPLNRLPSLVALGLLCLLPVPLVLTTGCGGSTATKNNETGNRLIVPLDWPARGRALPQAANSVRVQILQGTTVVANQVAHRPSGDAAVTSDLTIDNLPNGNLTARITAHSDDSADLVEIASVTFPFTLSSGTSTLSQFSLTSTITQLTLLPVLTQLTIGQGQEVIATPRNAAGQYVVAYANNYTWTISDPSVISLTTNGDRATLQGLKLGTATLSLTERETGLSTQATITVVAQTTTPPGSTYTYTLIADSGSEIASFGRPRLDENGRAWFVGTRKAGGQALYAGENSNLSRYAATSDGQFSALGDIGEVSPSGSAVVFSGTLASGNDPGLFVLRNNAITLVTSESTDIRNISADAVVNDSGNIAFVAQGDPGFSDSDTRNIYRSINGLSQRLYQGTSTTAQLSLYSIEADNTIYFNSTEASGVSRIAPDGTLTQIASAPFDPNVSAYTAIPQGTSIQAFGTRIRPDGSGARRNRKGQLVFRATGDDGRTLLVRADPAP